MRAFPPRPSTPRPILHPAVQRRRYARVGRTNCNRFFGKYELKGQKLEFENLGMTRMACPEMQYEDAFVKMLDEVDGYEIKGEELKFYDDKKLLAEFRAVQDAAAQKK